jgi:hypothetical protein
MPLDDTYSYADVFAPHTEGPSIYGHRSDTIIAIENITNMSKEGEVEVEIEDKRCCFICLALLGSRYTDPIGSVWS